MNSICFIPAKGNSKRLPCKNVQIVGGKSLILRAIEGAIDSNCFDKIIVSSNNADTLEIASKAGVVPIDRSEELCADDIRAKDVFKVHLNNDEMTYDIVTMLMPTCPLRTSNHIKEAYTKFCKLDCKTLVSVTEFNFNPRMAMTIKNDVLISFFLDEFEWEREEKFPKAYHMNGAIFLSKYDYFMKNTTFVEKKTIPYIMDRLSSIDVDTPEDLLLAEFYWRVINDRYN